ncbi:uncharacterized protein DUF4342 [Natranaerovirga pectinivora]|uniref:Uncharacterized protein DUF4342 n=1 Tax=Natranaerovirga pectinivora TaxID=682400 RepID=A0A4R3MTB0_9FIRM|nr:DUF4342 domain-containing protein [Natranaerovirga pectinivora]TCT16294.1 uncharacterized protein DUF4342 [Natranaerovirga pectinivora]
MNTIEKIEYLRGKADINYEEARIILEKHNDDVVKALCELEKRGLVYNTKKSQSKNNNNSQEKSKTNDTNQKDEKSFGDSLKELFRKGNENRLVVKRNNDIIANISINYTLFFIIFAPHLAVFTLVLTLILGYKIRFKKEKSHSDIKVNEFVEKAASNVKESVKSFVEEFDKEDEIVDVYDDEYGEIIIED